MLLELGGDEAVAAGGLGVSRVATLLGRDKSQISRTLKILAESGLVDRDPGTRAYRLGWRIYALASLAGERRLLDAGRPVLADLVAQLSERAHLSVLQGADALTVLSESPAHATLQSVGWVGRAVPAWCTSAGRALLLDHDRTGLEQLFRGVPFDRRGPNTVPDVVALAERIESARAAGYVTVDEEFEPGLVSAAAPFRDPQGRIVAALNVSGPKFRLHPRLDEAGEALLEAADELSHTVAPRFFTGP